MKKFSLFLLLTVLTACSTLMLPESTPTALPTPSITPSATRTPEPTPTPTLAPTEVIDLESWNSTPDKKIAWRQRDLTIYNNQYFIPNPETSDRLYDKLFTFVCAINYHTYARKFNGIDFIQTYNGSFTKYCDTYIKSKMVVDNLRLLTAHPYRKRWDISTTVQIDERIDLSKFSIAIADYESATPENGFVSTWGNAKFKMQVVQYIDNTFILQFVFSNGNKNAIPEYKILGLNADSTIYENLLSLIQVMNIVVDEGAKLSMRDSKSVIDSLPPSSKHIVTFTHAQPLSISSATYFDQKAKGAKYLLIR